MVDRIKKLLATEQMSHSQFADEINLQRSSLSHVLSGRNNPSLDFVMKIKLRFSEVNLDWLILGTGHMYSGKHESDAVKNVKENHEKIIGDTQQSINFDSRSTIDHEEKPSIAEKTTTEIERLDVKSGTGRANKVIIFFSNGTFEEFVKG